MAQLNLRDRTIEATIAYVGSGGHQATTSFERITRDGAFGRAGVLAAKDVSGGRLVSLDWRPRTGARMNDCELAVKLVTAEGEVETTTMQSVLVDADGLILMLEAGPEAEPQNRRTVAQVRDALSRAPDKRVAVVVQVNRGEGSEASASEDAAVTAAAGLGDEDWPRVIACPTKGEGVMETLQRAVDGVVDTMQKRSGDEAPAARAAGSPRTEGNPLLAALRQVLQATVSEQMASLETRIAQKLDDRRPTEAPSGLVQMVAELADRIARIETAVVEMRSATPPGEQIARVGHLVSESASRDAAMGERLGALEDVIGRVESALVEASARTLAATERLASREDVTRVSLRISEDSTSQREAQTTAATLAAKENRRAIQEEVPRALSSAVQPLQRAVEGLSAEIRKWTATEAAAGVAAALEKVRVASESLHGKLDALVVDTKAATDRLGEVESSVLQGDIGVGRRIAEVNETVRAFEAKTGAGVLAVQTELGAIGEELKKKKSWFG